jgi:hypothetical protein
MYEEGKTAEKDCDDDAFSPAHLLMHKIVQRFGEQKKASPYNPRFTRIMASLKKTPAYQEGLKRKEIVPLDADGIVNVVNTGSERQTKTPILNDHNQSFSSYDGGQVAISFDLSSSDVYDDDDDYDRSSREEVSTVDMSQYVNTMQEKTPELAKKIRAHRADLRRILQKSNANKEVRSQMKADGANLSDSSDDSYPDDGVDACFSLSSDSGIDSGSENSENEDNDSSSSSDTDDSLTLNEIACAKHRIAVKEDIVSDLFIKPKRNGSLLQRIQKNRDGIQKIGLKRRVQGIEESFVLNTQAHRSSILANQSRAHTKLQKRIKQRKIITASTDEVGDGVKEEQSQASSDRVTTDQQTAVGEGSSRSLQKLTSFEVFKEKKAMVIHYTAHQSLRRHSLETQRLQAKASLKLRVSGKKKEGNL